MKKVERDKKKQCFSSGKQLEIKLLCHVWIPESVRGNPNFLSLELG